MQKNMAVIHVFVHLTFDFGLRIWQKGRAEGWLIGINDPSPYGYDRADAYGCRVVYSDSPIETEWGRSFRIGIRSLLGVDIIHAWRNRKQIYESDIVWTHTEFEYVAILLLFRLLFWKRRPKLIGQTIWLFDQWSSLGAFRRFAFTRLIPGVDLLTVLSPENLKAARALFPHTRSEFVPFGINTDRMTPPKDGEIHDPIRLLSIGNDVHRDWPTLIQAVTALPDCHLKIISTKLNPEAVRDHPNIEVIKIQSSPELNDQFDWADFVLLPLKPNLHASGITVLEEAAVFGKAVICSDTGGLKAYFSDEEVCFVPPCDSAEIRKAIRKLAGDDRRRSAMAWRAQAKMAKGQLNAQSYARRHVELSRELLGRPPLSHVPNATHVEGSSKVE